MKITVSDIRAAGVCVAGLKDFCRAHRLDLRELIDRGWEEKVLTGIDDVMVKRVLEVAHERRQKTDNRL